MANINAEYFKILLSSKLPKKDNIKKTIDLLLKNNKEFLDNILNSVNTNKYETLSSNYDKNKIYLDDKDRYECLFPYLEDRKKTLFFDRVRRVLYKYWQQIYNINKDTIDKLLQEQFDRQQLKISKDFHEIKYIIEKYNIKNTSEDDLKKRGIDSISDKELLQYIYKNLMDDENYKGAEYIVNILGDNSLKLQFEKDRMQQGEFKFGTTAYKLDFLSRAILRI